jgi:cardiolipin synthase
MSSSSQPILQLPNILTLARIALVPLIIACYFAPTELVQHGRWLALLLFIAGAITDYLDGWYARKWNMSTPLGRFLDPIADKLAVVAVLVMLIMTQRISGIDVIAAYLIVGREILVSGLREYLAELRDKIVVPVSYLAKWKTVLQMTALIALLLIDAYPPLEPVAEIGYTCLWLAAALSLWTAWSYFQAFYDRLFADPA